MAMVCSYLFSNFQFFYILLYTSLTINIIITVILHVIITVFTHKIVTVIIITIK
jgi:hypothetical protein